VPLDLLNNVFLLHLALKTPQSVFEGFSLLQSHFRQRNTPPNSSQFGLVSYCKIPGLSQVDRIDRVNHVDPEVLVWVDERQFTTKEFPSQESQKLSLNANCNSLGAYALVARVKLVGTW